MKSEEDSPLLGREEGQNFRAKRLSVERIWASPPPLEKQKTQKLRSNRLSVGSVWGPPPPSEQQSIHSQRSFSVAALWAPPPKDHVNDSATISSQDTNSAKMKIRDGAQNPSKTTGSIKKVNSNVDYRPERVFEALEGQKCDVTGDFRFDVGPRVWVLTGKDGNVAIKEITGVEHALSGPFVATIQYDSERTWVRSVQRKVSDVKLFVMGKLKFAGSQSQAAKLDSLFSDIEAKLLSFTEVERKAAVEVMENGKNSSALRDTDDDHSDMNDYNDDDDFVLDPVILNQLKMSRSACFSFYFMLDVSWGIWTALYSFYITDVLKASDSVMIYSYMILLYSLVHFLTAPSLGCLVDAIGRRPVIIVGSFCNMVMFTLWGVIESPFWWVLASAVAFFDGSTVAINSVIVDCAVLIPAKDFGDENDYWISRWVYTAMRHSGYDTEKPDISLELRSGFMLLYAYAILGLIVGDIFGSIIYELVGLSWGMASAGLILIPMIVYLYIYLPETLQDYQKKEVSFSIVVNAFFDQLRNFEIITSSLFIATLTLLYCVAYTCQSAFSTAIFYWLEDKYGWGEGMIALYLLSYYILVPVMAIIINKYMLPAFGFERIFSACYILAGIGYILQNFSVTNWEVWLAGMSTLFGISCYLLMPGLITPMIGHSDAGRLQGALYSVGMLAQIVGTYGGYRFYDATLDDNYAAPLWWAVGFANFFSALLCVVMISMTTRKNKLDAAT